MVEINVAILKNEMPQDHDGWVNACNSFNNDSVKINYNIIELFSDNWLEQMKSKSFDLILFRSPGRSSFFKQIYDERSMLINQHFGNIVYPNLNLIQIYENKRFFRDWLLLNNIPHPKTWVFYTKNDALDYINSRKYYPIVSKLNIGASGKGVKFINNKTEGIIEINKQFGVGKKIVSGPYWNKGSFWKKINKVLFKKNFIKTRMIEYNQQKNEVHKNYIIFQEFIPHEFEWRCVVIGESFFAHKKIIKGQKTSGSLLKEYGEPPLSLLNFIRHISKKYNIDSAAIDLFEQNGEYLINEIQCFFGQSDLYQMEINGAPGRYVFKNNDWIFEKGYFNNNQCYDLRLSHALNKVMNKL
jgi:glutathione synthase/RimK-type ligase-like ATP-grasp enzyme